MAGKPLCVIPARGGSKRLPRKNILPLNGKPLLAYTVEAALKSGVFDEVFVSTEDQEIAEIARRFGASVPGLRPGSLATDKATMADVCLDMIERVEKSGRKHHILYMLSPTCPLLLSRNIHEALVMFQQSDAPSLLSVTDFDHPPFWALKKEEDGRLVPYWGNEYIRKTQELPHVYRPNGAIAIANIAEFRRVRTFYGVGLAGYYMPRSQSIDIDDEFDFRLAECIIRSRDKH